MTSIHGLIDAHHHLWPRSAIPQQTWRPAEDEILRRGFEPEDLAPELTAAGVDATIVMQSVDDLAENRRLVDYARRASYIAGVVAYAPLPVPAEARGVIEALRTKGMPDAETGRDAPGRDAPVVGVRCLIGHGDADWAVADDALDVFRRLADLGQAWDVVPVTPSQVAAVAEVARRVPRLRVVVDHLARPPFSVEGWEAWTESVARLSARENIAVKLSVGVDVLGRPGRWDTGLLRAYVSHALEAFGARRSMMASNWPVILLKTGYRDAWSETLSIVSDVVDDAASLERVGSGTAKDWYGLDRRREQDA